MRREPAYESDSEVFGRLGFQSGEPVRPVVLPIDLDELRMSLDPGAGEDFPSPGFDCTKRLRVRIYCEFNVETGQLEEAWFQQVPDNPDPEGEIEVIL